VGINVRLPSLCIVPCALFWVGQDIVHGLAAMELLESFFARIAVEKVESRWDAVSTERNLIGTLPIFFELTVVVELVCFTVAI